MLRFLLLNLVLHVLKYWDLLSVQPCVIGESWLKVLHFMAYVSG